MLALHPSLVMNRLMQLTTFIINWVVVTFPYYWGIKLLLLAYQRQVTTRRLCLFCAFAGLLLNINVLYSPLLMHLAEGHTTVLRALMLLLPLAFLALSILGVRVLVLPPCLSLKILYLSCVFSLWCNAFLNLTAAVLVTTIPSASLNGSIGHLPTLAGGLIMVYVFFVVCRHLLHKTRFCVSSSDVLTENKPLSLLKHVSLGAIIFTFAAFVYADSPVNHLRTIIVWVFSTCYILVELLRDWLKMYRQQLFSAEQRIAVLNQSIQEFKGLRHDIGNILQTYSGFLAVADLDSLAEYHHKVTQSVALAGAILDLGQRVTENPPFFALVISKMDRAKNVGILLQVALFCNMKDIYIDSLDFSRIMAILLDNAIEAAEVTPSKRMTVDGHMKPDGSKHFIISNDTLQAVPVGDLFTPGYTTKADHTGLGLTQVQRILQRYPNCTLKLTYQKGIFTVHLGLCPHTPTAKMGRKMALHSQLPI